MPLLKQILSWKDIELPKVDIDGREFDNTDDVVDEVLSIAGSGFGGNNTDFHRREWDKLLTTIPDSWKPEVLSKLETIFSLDATGWEEWEIEYLVHLLTGIPEGEVNLRFTPAYSDDGWGEVR